MESFLLAYSALEIVIGAIVLILGLSYLGAPLLLWTGLTALFLYGLAAVQGVWIAFGIIAAILNIPALRRIVLTGPIFMMLKKLNILPAISDTEKIAIEAGNVWVDGELFSGHPNFKRCFTQPEAKLTDEEQAFLDGPCKEVCDMVDDFDVFQKRDLPPQVWDYLKAKKFFGMIIPKSYGGLGFSAYAHSQVIAMLSARCTPLGITVMVPNSLGPGELLVHYGTDDQRNHYLPKLANGEHIPAFALTEPGAGSDAGSITSSGEIMKDESGQLVVKLNWEKRYITLAAISTVLGLAIKLKDPQNLLGKGTDLGITCVLVPADTPGVTLGRRHDPLGVPFYNCPTLGKDVTLPLSAIIGGAEGAGNGWRMLMESLAAGRGISLPATSTGGAKLVSRVVGAYSAIRMQFGMSIGKFEGIAEPMAEIGGFTYMLDATRKYTCGGLDSGSKPPVITAITKYMFTELYRKCINHGMDILGGAAISRGKRNLLAHPYIGTPISITVEGANILTRTLIVFGQGAIRCHPYARKEIEAIEKNDLKSFDKAFIGHMGHVSRNKNRAFLLSLTRGHLTCGGGKHSIVKKYSKKLSWVSATYAFWADVAMGTLGGELKRKEMLTGRFADILGWQYLAMCTLKRFEMEGHRKEDIPLVEWSLQYALHQIQLSFDGIFNNMSWWAKPIGVWSRFNTLSKGPSDNLSIKVANILQKPGAQRDALTDGLFISSQEGDSLKRYEDALIAITQAQPILAKVKAAQKKKTLPKGSTEGLLELAIEKNVISSAEAAQLKDAEKQRQDAIQVDWFSLEDYKAYQG